MSQETFGNKFQYFCPHCFHPLTVNEDESEILFKVCPNHPDGSIEYKYIIETNEETE